VSGRGYPSTYLPRGAAKRARAGQYEAPVRELLRRWAARVRDDLGLLNLAEHIDLVAQDMRFTADPFVYFIECGESGPIKIGLSYDVKQRLRDLQPANPHELRLLARMPGGAPLEESLHYTLRHANIRSEWFAPVKELATLIQLAKSFEGAT
jgi:hypothetical protein